ncbi:hypothetical protein [Aquimarina pacifica]|uniref:hypothetical protein n=1 Tax=Aquimarina pacifica TaxID=1296415 RepID=UPI00046EB23C|nr:hypothetical protein [Aquimarina pacifica]
MKRISFILFLLSFSLFTACSDDDNANEQEDDSSELTGTLTGDWNLTGLTASDGTLNTTVEGQAVSLSYTAIGKDFNTEVSFSESPNVVTSSGSFTTEVTFSFFGIEESQEVPGQEFAIVGTWSLEGDQLTILNTTTSEERIATVTTLTDTTLIFEIEIDENLEDSTLFEGFDLTGTITGTVVYTLTK